MKNKTKKIDKTKMPNPKRKPKRKRISRKRASKQLNQIFVGDNDHEPDHPWWITST